MTTQEIVSKLWNLCNVLKDDGITYHQYVTELTYILFLKMLKETEKEDRISDGIVLAQGDALTPEEITENAEKQVVMYYSWDTLKNKSGLEQYEYYKDLLRLFGKHGVGHVKEIYQKATTNIDEPKNLEKIITTIDGLDWYSAREEGLGNLYEGLLEKNANEKKSGAGQYFTPRVLIDVMTKLVKPQVGERCNDPACGTFGFMIAAHQYVADQTDNFFDIEDADMARLEKEGAFTGCELVPDTHRLAVMNAMLHDIESPIMRGDTLSNIGKTMHDYDVVLTNPPFGTKKGGERATRDDFTYPTSNKQLNFLQHIYRSLKADGKARAAVVLPDNVLFADGDGEKIRLDLMNKCNLHTILRLPTGIFYAQGVKTNVLFFTRGRTDRDNTKEVWVYDLRNDMPSFGKTNPLKPEHFDEFMACYADGDLSKRKETYSEENPNGRWRKFTIEDILARDKTSLDITWMKSNSGTDDYTLAELLDQIKEKSQNIARAVSALEQLIGEVEE